MSTTYHPCAVVGCKNRCKLEHLMCLEHWRKVTQKTATEVYRSQRAWQKGELSEAPYAAAVAQAKREAVRP